MSLVLKIDVGKIRKAVAEMDWDEQVSIETLLEQGRMALFRCKLRRAILEVFPESRKS